MCSSPEGSGPGITLPSLPTISKKSRLRVDRARRCHNVGYMLPLHPLIENRLLGHNVATINRVIGEVKTRCRTLKVIFSMEGI